MSNFSSQDADGTLPSRRGGTSSTSSQKEIKSIIRRGLRVAGWPILILILLLIAWPLIAHFFATSVVSANDLSALLATLGSLMGAIFAVGGLVVALVSVFTLFSIEKQVESKFKEILPTLEERADYQIEGHIAFMQASEAQSWKAAVTLTREALQKYPKLKKARSLLGIRLANDVLTYFSYQLTGNANPTTLQLSAQSTRLYTLLEDPPTIEAVEWLIQARDHEDTLDGEVWAALALMYGFHKKYDQMLENITLTLRENQNLQEEYFRAPWQVMMLVHACGNNRDRIQVLGEKIGLELPASKQAIRKSLEQLTMLNSRAQWYAMELAQGASDYPAKIDLHRTDKPTGMFVHPRFFRPGKMMERYTDQNGADEFLPAEEVIDKLSEQFLFICTIDQGMILLFDAADSPGDNIGFQSFYGNRDDE